jgi:flavin reductase
MNTPAIDPTTLRRALGSFATGVTVISYEVNGEACGTTINSFTSVSLEPPLLLVSVLRHGRAGAVLSDRPFTVNVLGHDQELAAQHFAGRPQEGFAVSWVSGERAPRLAENLAWFECAPWRTYDGGDHLLVLGEVIDFAHGPEAPALLFHRGKWLRS